jgi:hypothetical protein
MQGATCVQNKYGDLTLKYLKYLAYVCAINVYSICMHHMYVPHMCMYHVYECAINLYHKFLQYLCAIFHVPHVYT